MTFYESTNQVAILKERIKELSRIRRGFEAHLGASLYEATKDDETLRWGRESLYEGIEMCEEERKRLLQAIAQIELEESLGHPLDEEEPAAPAEEAAEPVEIVAEETEETVAFEAPVEVVAEPEVEEVVAEDAVEIVEFDANKSDELVQEDVPVAAFGLEHEGEAEGLYAAVSVAEPAPATNVCPNCGFEVGPDDRFCMECGSPLGQAAPAPAPAQTGICPNCGSPTEPGFKFCMICGQKL